MARKEPFSNRNHREIIRRALDDNPCDLYKFLMAAMPLSETGIPERRLAAARELQKTETDPVRAAFLRILVARIHAKKGNFHLIPEEVAALAEDGSLTAPVRAVALRLVAEAELAKGDHAAAEATCLRAISICKPEDSFIRATIYNMLGQCFYYQAKFRESLKYFKMYKDAVAGTTDLHALGVAYNNMAVAYVGLGNAGEAEKSYTQLLDVARKSVEHHTIALALSNLSGLMINQNRYDEALSYADRAFEVFKNVEDVSLVTVTLIFKADALQGLGRLPEAHKVGEQAVFFAKNNERKFMYPWSKAVFGKILAAEKNPGAKECFEESVSKFREFLPGGAPEEIEFALLGLGKILLAEKNPKGREYLKEALKILKTRGRWKRYDKAIVEAEKLLSARSRKKTSKYFRRGSGEEKP